MFTPEGDGRFRLPYLRPVVTITVVATTALLVIGRYDPRTAVAIAGTAGLVGGEVARRICGHCSSTFHPLAVVTGTVVFAGLLAMRGYDPQTAVAAAGAVGLVAGEVGHRVWGDPGSDLRRLA